MKAFHDRVFRIPEYRPHARQVVRRLVRIVMILGVVFAGMGLGRCAVLAAVAAEAPPVRDFDSAAQAYERGEFDASARSFERLAASDANSPTVWFNAGNAWFKAGRIGRAIVAYRRAAALAPRDSDVRHNLSAARARAGAASASGVEGISTGWATRLTSGEWAILTCLASWAAVAALVWRGRAVGPRPTKGALPWVAFVILVLSALGWSLSVHQRSPEAAVIVVPEAAIRFGPLEESPLAFRVTDGTEVRVKDAKGGWNLITASGAREGWVKSEDLLRVFPRPSGTSGTGGSQVGGH